MNNLAELTPTIDERSPEPTWCKAILTGPYLKKTLCKLQLDPDGRILDCNRIKSVYSGKPQFDQWFRDLYHPVVFKP